MTRSQIRYALFRCKAGTADDSQKELYNQYLPQLSEFGLSIEEFTKEWDIDKKDTSLIVTGSIARHYNKETSLFPSE